MCISLTKITIAKTKWNIFSFIFLPNVNIMETITLSLAIVYIALWIWLYFEAKQAIIIED